MAWFPWLAGGALAVGGAVLIGGLCENRRLSVSTHTVSLPALPPAFEGYRLVHLSDLHAAAFGPDQSRLVAAVMAQEPDAVVITGDLIDRRRTHTDDDMRPALTLLRRLSEQVVTLYVDGNHEPLSTCGDRFHELAARTKAIPVTGTTVYLTADGDRLPVIGVPDMAAVGYDADRWKAELHRLCDPHQGGAHLVLSHRPHRTDTYRELGHTAVLSGHAHGGQWRLPFLGGLFAPDQGILPRFTEGLHRLGETQLIISRGLGNSGFPLRLFNPPEIVVITLHGALDE